MTSRWWHRGVIFSPNNVLFLFSRISWENICVCVCIHMVAPPPNNWAMTWPYLLQCSKYLRVIWLNTSQVRSSHLRSSYLKYLQFDSHGKEGWSAMTHSLATLFLNQESFREPCRPHENQYKSIILETSKQSTYIYLCCNNSPKLQHLTNLFLVCLKCLISRFKSHKLQRLVSTQVISF